MNGSNGIEEDIDRVMGAMQSIYNYNDMIIALCARASQRCLRSFSDPCIHSSSSVQVDQVDIWWVILQKGRALIQNFQPPNGINHPV